VPGFPNSAGIKSEKLASQILETIGAIRVAWAIFKVQISTFEEAWLSKLATCFHPNSGLYP